MSNLGSALDFAAMMTVLRRQQDLDLRFVFQSPAERPLCEWPGCQHRAVRDHGAGSAPRWECDPHAMFGAQYERVRGGTGALFGAVSTVSGLAATLLAPDGDLRNRGRALLAEGVRSLLATTKKG